MVYSIVIPVYNSSATLHKLLEEIGEVMAQVDGSYEVIFVDDCSPDNSWEVLKEVKKLNPSVKIARLANNVGQWMATLAGVKCSKGRYIITIDDDLEYHTEDIKTLIDAFHRSDSHIVYGIPHEKKNKNIYYKLFFRLRDKFLRILFGKIKTESFKIFKRELYFDEEDRMMSYLHFEAYTKFVVSTRFISHVPVKYRRRFAGKSNHTLWMKVKLLFRYGPEYYKSPFRIPLYLLLFFAITMLVSVYVKAPEWLMLAQKFALALLTLFIFGILGNYLSSLYFKLKGQPEFIIIEEY